MTEVVQAKSWKSVADQACDQSIGAIVGAVAGIVMATLGLIFAPYGDAVQELLDPTSATVSGRVSKGQAPANGVVVMVDDSITDETGGLGLFYIPEVADGLHDVVVLERGSLALKDQIMVPKRVDEYAIADIDLAAAPLPPLDDQVLGGGSDPDAGLLPAPEPMGSVTQLPSPSPAPNDPGPALSLSPEASEASPAASLDASPPEDESTPTAPLTLSVAVTPVTSGERASGMPEGAHRIQVRLQGTVEQVGEVGRVTYYLDPSFSPSVVSRYAAEDGFLLVFVSSIPFTLAAEVHLADGTVLPMEEPIVF